MLFRSYGPRYVMVGILFVSAIPCGLAGTITSVTGEPMLLKYTVEKSDTIPRSGLYLIRFFVGIAGAAFVPCRSSTPTSCPLPTSADPLSHCRSLVVSRIHWKLSLRESLTPYLLQHWLLRQERRRHLERVRSWLGKRVSPISFEVCTCIDLTNSFLPVAPA